MLWRSNDSTYGQKKRWHFKHKSGTFCNYETYLHKIAKIRIREDFLKSERFEISFNPIHECSVECPIGKGIPCRRHKYVKFDIRKYYDKCEEEEAPIEGFRADLLLTSSLFPKEPILIEIAVSHKSTAEKIKSGYRIIEIPIESEEDIANIIDKNIGIGV